MPLYEYQCGRCGKRFEVMQKFSDEPLTVHEECGGPVERLLSPPALQFKGSGWYVTDYARSKNSPATNGKSESKTESKPETKSETKSETKPAAPASDK
jgi:putative FmdB family regulatory protein